MQPVAWGHGGRVVTLSPPTCEAGVRFPARPQVGKMVAQNALVLGSSGHVQSDPTVPAQSTQSGDLSQPFNQTLHRNLSNLNLHAWLLKPQQSRSRASLRQWQSKLRLLKEDQPDQSMRQSGPFLQSGASVIMWKSGHHL